MVGGGDTGKTAALAGPGQVVLNGELLEMRIRVQTVAWRSPLSCSSPNHSHETQGSLLTLLQLPVRQAAQGLR